MNSIKKIFFIVRELVSALIKNHKAINIIQNLRYIPRWWISMSIKNSLDDCSPWLCYEAIDYLDNYLKPDMKLFEYGSGGSTLFFAKRVDTVISIEHNKEWFDKVKDYLKRLNINNVKYRLVEATKDPKFEYKETSNPNDFVSEDDNFIGYSFESYVRTIDDYPDGYFDCIVIDGRARPSCLLHSINKVKIGGIIVFDNAERNYYKDSLMNLTKSMKGKVFYGFVPYLDHFSKTLIILNNKSSHFH